MDKYIYNQSLFRLLWQIIIPYVIIEFINHNILKTKNLR
jgi:hypothetical protein